MLCEYGCGNEAQHELKNGKKCCSKSHNSCPEVRKKNSVGLKQAYQDGRKVVSDKVFGQNRGWSKGKTFLSDHRLKSSLDPNKIFIENCPYTPKVVRQLIFRSKIIDYKCAVCGIDKWNEKEIRLQVDHINGKNNDNRIQNLRFLCPNCHSQTNTYCGKNINGRKPHIEECVFVDALKESKNIRQTLIKLGLTPKGANYDRARHLIEKYNI